MRKHPFVKAVKSSQATSSMLTPEHLRAKIAELEQQRMNYVNEANACTGAINFARAVLAELEAPAPADPVSAAANA